MTRLQFMVDYLHNIARYLPHATFVAVITLLAGLGITGNYSLVFKGASYLIPLLIISLLLIISNQKNLCNDNHFQLFISFRQLIYLYIIFSIVLLILLMLDIRGLPYIIIFILMYISIILQIFSKNLHTSIILVELILTTSLLILSRFFSVAYYYADTDLLFHANAASGILSTGAILPSEIVAQYLMFPIYQIYIAIATCLTTLPSNVSIYVCSVFPVISSLIFISYISYYFTKSERISLLAAFCFSVIPVVIVNLKFIAPRAMATFAAIILFYLIFNSHIKDSKILALLSLVSAMYLVLVHPVQQLLILIILLIICIGSILYFKKFIVGNKIACIIVIFLSLIYITVSYLSYIINVLDSRFFSEIEMGNVNTVNEVIIGNEIAFFINNLASTFLLLFMFLGLFVLLTKISLNKKVVILIPLLSITFLFYIPGIADMFPFISQSLQFYRFQFPLSVFFAILMGIGCVALINLLYENKSLRKISLVLPIILCILIVISSQFVGFDADNNAILIDTDVTSRLYAHFDTEDLYLFDNIQNYIESGSVLYTDFSLYKYYFKNPSVQILGQSYYEYADNFQELFLMNVNVEDRGYVIFRSQAYYETRLTVSKGDYQTYIEPSNLSTYQFKQNIFLLNTIYDNDDGAIYTRGIV